MRPIARLPDRPLRPVEVARLDADDRLDVVPYGGLRVSDGFRIYALKVAVEDAAYAVGFDDDEGRWHRLVAVDAADRTAADDRLDATLDEWAASRYGDRFSLRKPG